MTTTGLGAFAEGLRGVTRGLGVALAMMVMTGAIAGAQTPAGDPAAAKPDPDAGFTNFFRSIELGGLADGYYVYNSNKPEGDASFRNFDTKHNSFSLNMAELWLAKAPTAESRAGFKVRLNYGPAANLIHAAEPGTSEVFENIEEVYVSYLAPAGKGLQIDFGKFVTQHGAEVIESKDNWNYSRALLFTLAIPYYHAGVRATYVFNDKFTLMANVVNGWNDVVDNNSAKTVGVQATIKPIPALSIVQNYMTGPEQAGNDDDWRQLSDTVVTYTASPMVSVMANYDYGKDTLLGTGVHWQGIAGYAKIQASPIFAVIPRVEWFDDPDGFTTGTAQTLKEVTVTGEVKLADNLLWRIEYRHDSSDVASFKKSAGDLSKTQNTIGFGLMYSFSTKQ
jgi:Putative beta-barrel porin-2, OmpL-like. bbp2